MTFDTCSCKIKIRDAGGNVKYDKNQQPKAFYIATRVIIFVTTDKRTRRTLSMFKSGRTNINRIHAVIRGVQLDSLIQVLEMLRSSRNAALSNRRSNEYMLDSPRALAHPCTSATMKK